MPWRQGTGWNSHGTWQGGENEGLMARVTETLRRMYDSVVWVQRADRFLHRRRAPTARTPAEPSGRTGSRRDRGSERGLSIRRRDEVVSRILATTTGIDTLAVKAHSIALTSTGPDQTIDEVRRLRESSMPIRPGWRKFRASQAVLPEIEVS